MKLKVLKIDGSKGTAMSVDDAVFGIEPNKPVVRQAVLAELNNMRQGTHASKNRALVRGGGRKPFKQKGRGVARAGTTRSPIWRGGGTVFGPEPHAYSHKLPKKVGKLARRSVLSDKAANSQIILVDDLQVQSHKTADFVKTLTDLGLDGKKVTILSSGEDRNLVLASQNLYKVYLVDAKSASTYDLIDCEFLLLDKAGLAIITEVLAA
ncbi:MAG: 50S ribosomal protein L4 [Candidatus Marinimicrobia bacterium]|jgi:large subunit ribosomal protein L4|nr:50S ribosomal protein L4 [Candidatus Neomarinimicrobiota bacterium]MBT4635024.1 50S ribosomal protein L4 [Candidatus Neomarinimicrobiota bacterium]MBT4685618.1 50S ribosomal protein L4 [Candidatus Neomarinimicrobiota bacterium]MBT4735393.1 50S ribosomal protein L4 [Candidatus Neomarinimicrobiota bacterium]MBT6471613.1 50S ribosomal protein L4 [Candidatus Neomarinimicrobiota bacterium]